MTILTSKDTAEGFLLVETGRAEAYVMDDILLAGIVTSRSLRHHAAAG